MTAGPLPARPFSRRLGPFGRLALAALLALLGLPGCGDSGGASSPGGPDAGDATPGSDADAGPDAAADAADLVEDGGLEEVSIPEDRPILAFSGSTAVDANAAALPSDWNGIQPTRCAADPTRVFIGELVLNGIDNPQVLYHWAPIVPGPDPAHPVQAMPEFSMAGPLVARVESEDDVRADHPFGFDFTWDVLLDPEFAALTNGEDGTIHAEIEMPQFPRPAFGYDPQVGDRALLRGAWVLDCGHPPYGAELHPPTFLAFARAQSATETSALAFANPYRIAQLYTTEVDRVTAFDDETRFTSANTKPFPIFMLLQVLRAVQERADHLSAPGLMEATRFDTLAWDVCAPLPRPAGSAVDASWRFTARTGVSLSARVIEEAGCVHVEARMDDRYSPMPLVRGEVPWPWDEISQSAGAQLGRPIDVRQALIGAVEGLGYSPEDVPALAADHPPVVDHYDALAPLEGADRDAPTQVTEDADGQPFPFYGRVRVAWQ